MADSKSFFEKLTGSVKIDDESAEVNKGGGAEEISSDVDDAEVITAASSTLPRAKKEEKHIPIETDKLSSLMEADEEGDGQLTVDIFDNGDYIVIQSAVAGVDPENLDVAFHDGMITIRGRRERMSEAKEENYYYKELYWGTFSRSVVLPGEVDIEKAEATLKNGILTVRLPKKDKIRQQKIKVKVV